MAGVRFDGGLGALVEDGGWELVAGGFGFTEGPVWRDGALYFSDIPNSRIHAWRDGALSVVREPSGRSNGLTLDAQRRVLACEHEGRRVAREEGDAWVDVATHYDGKRLNSPNDIIVASDGRIFFTDPPYGIREEQRELTCNGVYAVDAGGGAPELIADDFDRPNGLALSPDERTLYIADTNRLHVRAFDVVPGGKVANGRVFAGTREAGRPDGIKVDRDGRVYVCAGSLQVFEPDGGLLGLLDCPQPPANCAWGDDGGTLYITARSAVYRRRLNVRGIAPAFR